MRWDQGHESPDVIDRRGEGRGGGGMLGGGGLLALAPLLIRSPLGIVILLVLLIGSGVAGIFGTRGEGEPPASGDQPKGAVHTTGADQPQDEARRFTGFVLDDAQKTWREAFAKAGKPYRNAKLVLYTDATRTACGFGEAATGPFYCPSDERVYIDLAFNDELARRFGAKGDFAQAYVVAHEIGHHVQKLLGVDAAIKNLRRSEREGESSASVRLELQADCFAGVWAHSTDERGLLENGDINEAMTAAAAVGDDRLQKAARGTVHPESFTHGTSAQRSKWFRVGLDRGDPAACDTFKAASL